MKTVARTWSAAGWLSATLIAASPSMLGCVPMSKGAPHTTPIVTSPSTAQSVRPNVPRCQLAGTRVGGAIRTSVGSLGEAVVMVDDGRGVTVLDPSVVHVRVDAPIALEGDVAVYWVSVRTRRRILGAWSTLEAGAPLAVVGMEADGRLVAHTASRLLTVNVACDQLETSSVWQGWVHRIAASPDRRAFLADGAVKLYGRPADERTHFATIRGREHGTTRPFVMELLEPGAIVSDDYLHVALYDAGVRAEGYVRRDQVQQVDEGPAPSVPSADASRVDAGSHSVDDSNTNQVPVVGASGTYGMGIPFADPNAAPIEPRRVQVPRDTPIFATMADRIPWTHTTVDLAVDIYQPPSSSRAAVRSILVRRACAGLICAPTEGRFEFYVSGDLVNPPDDWSGDAGLRSVMWLDAAALLPTRAPTSSSAR